MNRKHRCAAKGCEKQIALALFMCLRHWKMVPTEIQREIWNTYRKGQEHDMDISPEYRAAISQAITAVEKAEYGTDA